VLTSQSYLFVGFSGDRRPHYMPHHHGMPVREASAGDPQIGMDFAV